MNYKLQCRLLISLLWALPAPYLTAVAKEGTPRGLTGPTGLKLRPIISHTPQELPETQICGGALLYLHLCLLLSLSIYLSIYLSISIWSIVILLSLCLSLFHLIHSRSWVGVIADSQQVTLLIAVVIFPIHSLLHLYTDHLTLNS